jgi:hypothetical protein
MVAVSDKTKHGLFTVYNLTVNKDHTYYVGKSHGGIWVHNTCRLSPEGEALQNAVPVGSALKGDPYHNRATFMRQEAAENGTHFPLLDDAGNVDRTLTQLSGEMNGTAGRFEYIVNKAGELTHQMFVRGGSINGVPIDP